MKGKYYKFLWDPCGEHIGYGEEERKVVGAFVEEKGDVHFGEPDSGSEDGFVEIGGDTYRNKETIKEAGYGQTERRFVDGSWECKQEYADMVIVLLMERDVEVTCEVELVPQMNIHDSFVDHAKTVLVTDEDSELFEFFDEEDKIVSETRCGKMARLANFESCEEFADYFNLSVVPDSEAEEIADA